MMSKRIQPFSIAVLVLVLGALSLVMNTSAGAGIPQRSRALKREVATSATRHAAIISTTSAVLKETSEIRQLPILRPVKSGAQSRADIERMLIRNINKQRTPEEMHAAEVALKKFGLAPQDFDYRSFIIRLLTEQVAGYYDPASQRFHLADWLDLEGQKPVMAHELAHALQDQHFNLRRFEKWPRGDADAEIAAHALIEGDATLAMTMYMLRYPMVALAFRKSLGGTGISTEQFDLAPRAIRESLMFPYLNGSEWATHVYRRGGWAAVSNAYTQLPLSSEQILHAEKYFSYERPVKVTLPEVTNLLNASLAKGQAGSNQQTGIGSQQLPISRQPGRRRAPLRARPPLSQRPLPPATWRRIESDVNGEWGYYLLLDQYLKATPESKRAAAGWGGDRYDIYEGPRPGQVFLAHVSAWDTENDAQEFFDAYVKRTKLRYPGAKQLEAKNSESSAEMSTRRMLTWKTAEGMVILDLHGSRVVILEGIPDGVESAALLEQYQKI